MNDRLKAACEKITAKLSDWVSNRRWYELRLSTGHRYAAYVEAKGKCLACLYVETSYDNKQFHVYMNFESTRLLPSGAINLGSRLIELAELGTKINNEFREEIERIIWEDES